MNDPAALPARARALLAALAELGGQAAPGEVGARAGLGHSAQARGLAELRAAGLVAGGKRTVTLTPAGWAAAGATAALVGAGPALDEALRLWPAWHQAFLRLALGAIVARWHLAEQRPAAHLGLVAVGPTGTGKTAMAEWLCWALGLDVAGVTVLLPTATDGEVTGRSEPAAGGRRYVPAPALAGPLVFVDEYDKAEAGLRREALALFQGNARWMREGTMVTQRATPMLAANPPAAGGALGRLLPGEYRRRSVVMDTRELALAAGELARRLRAFELERRPPPLLLEACRPSAHLDEAAFATLAEVRSGLTDVGAEHLELRALEACALGRAGLLGLRPDADLQAAALETAVDYLVCAETVGEAVAGWQVDVDAWRRALGAGADLAGLERAVAEHRAQRARVQAEVRRRRAAGEVEDLAVVRSRGELAEQLRQAAGDLDLRRVPRPHRPAARGLGEELKALRARVLACRGADRLAHLAELAGEPLARAAALRQRIDAEQQAGEQQAAQARREVADRKAADAAARTQATEAARAARRQQAARQRSVEAHRRRHRAELVRLRKRRRTRPGEQVLARLLELGVVTPQQIVQQVKDGPGAIRRWWARSGGHSPPAPKVRTERYTAYVDLAGHRHRAGVLAAWETPATRAALDAALAAVDGTPAGGPVTGRSVVWGQPSALPGPRLAIEPPRRPGGL